MLRKHSLTTGQRNQRKMRSLGAVQTLRRTGNVILDIYHREDAKDLRLLIVTRSRGKISEAILSMISVGLVINRMRSYRTQALTRCISHFLPYS